MDFSSLSNPTGDGSLQRCLAAFSSDLGGGYDNEHMVPPSAVGVRRFIARSVATSQSCFISLRQNSEPLNASQLIFQRALLARLSHTESKHLCGLVAGHAEPGANYVVSTLHGLTSLHQLLRQERRIDVSRAREILTQLAEALEAATAARWPRVMLDAHALFLPPTSSEMAGSALKLIVPPLPGAGDMIPGAAGFPTSSNEYVQDIAYLACELLGMPARRQRFRPLPQLGAEANQVLRNVIEGGHAGAFGSASQFIAVFNAGLSSGGTTVAAGLSGVTTAVVSPVPPTATTAPPMVAAPHTGGMITSQQQSPAFVAPPPQPKLPPLLFPPKPERPLCRHLRLSSPSSPHLPLVGVFVGDQISVGRGGASHFVTQFFPRNPRNDSRTSLISRDHMRIGLQGGAVVLDDLPNTNPSFINGRPVPPGSTLRHSCRLTVAGEYDLDLRRLDSWWADGTVWQQEPENPPLASGSFALAPAPGAPVLEYRAFWVLTDAAFGLLPTGALNLQPSSIQGALGWFVAAHDGIWVVASEDDGSLMVDNAVLKAGIPVPLQHECLLRVGMQEWRVQALTTA